MNLRQLAVLAGQGHIDELNLVSLEGGFYVLQARMGQKAHSLVDDQGQGVRLHSISQVRELLQALPPLPCVLIQSVVHDEACRAGEQGVEPLRIPIGMYREW